VPPAVLRRIAAHRGKQTISHELKLAQRVRAAFLQAVWSAYVSAGTAVLGGEGRWELAVQAIRTLGLEPILRNDSRSTALDRTLPESLRNLSFPAASWGFATAKLPVAVPLQLDHENYKW
jgi:hypothetical protein